MTPQPAPTMPRPYTCFDEDRSATLLENNLREQLPFVFVRYGDGYLEAIHGKPGMTCDGERYSPALGAALLEAWDVFMLQGNLVYAGDWLASSFSGPTDPSIYEAEFRQLVGHYTPRFLHPECLLLMRESEALLDFYRAVKQDTRRKVYVGPASNAGAAAMLGAHHFVTPMRDLFQQVKSIAWTVADLNFDVLLWGAGMAGTIAVSRVFGMAPDRTYINLGSALDPLFRGVSRTQQLSPSRAREFFRELL